MNRTQDEMEAAEQAQREPDFFSDEPLAPPCPLRNEGDDICESCQ